MRRKKMEKHLLREKVVKEIELIPVERLNEVYDFIRFFRMGTERAETNKEKILSFAGCWEDMRDEIFNDYIAEIKYRRERAFSGRRKDETNIS